MFSKKSSESKKPRRSKESREQLVNMGLVPPDVGDDSDNDEDLEAELQKLMFGGSKAVKQKPKRTEVSQAQLDSMIAACMEDVPSDEEDGENDDDAELLDELAQFEDENEEEDDVVMQPVKPRAPPPKPSVKVEPCPSECAGQSLLSTIEGRIELYTQAEKKAKENGESSRARRFARGLATLTDLRKRVKAGKPINEEDIPPAITISSISTTNSNVSTPKEDVSKPLSDQSNQDKIPEPPKQAQSLPQSRTNEASADPYLDPIVKAIQDKRTSYRDHALKAKKSGDKQGAMTGLAGVKKCDELIEKVKKGEKVDLSLLPDLSASSSKQPPQVERTISRDEPITIPENPDEIPPPDHQTFGAPPPPTTTEEALQQRLAKYKQDEVKAKENGESSRARRLGRIVKQYEDAIKLHKKGQLATVLADLPCPPGFGAIPLTAAPQTSAHEPQVPKPPVQAPATAPKAPVTNPSVKKPMSLQDKQLAVLEKRQAQFKSAALAAKKAGQIEQAKEYLRQAKGFDSLIEATKSGLPVDFKTLPVAPQATRGKKHFEEINQIGWVKFP